MCLTSTKSALFSGRQTPKAVESLAPCACVSKPVIFSCFYFSSLHCHWCSSWFTHWIFHLLSLPFWLSLLLLLLTVNQLSIQFPLCILATESILLSLKFHMANARRTLSPSMLNPFLSFSSLLLLERRCFFLQQQDVETFCPWYERGTFTPFILFVLIQSR